MAIQDERGALSLARKEGKQEGAEARLEGCTDPAVLQRWLLQVLTAGSAPEARK